jgi:hypothetical protein
MQRLHEPLRGFAARVLLVCCGETLAPDLKDYGEAILHAAAQGRCH